MILPSWSGLRTPRGSPPPNSDAILRDGAPTHPQLQNAEGIDGLGERPGAGRKTRLTEAQRSWIISLVVASDPPGRLVRGAGWRRVLEAREEEEKGTHYWTLDAPTDAAREQHGIVLGSSQVRRIL